MIASSQISIILPDVSSCPWVLFISSALMIFRISSSVKLKVEKHTEGFLSSTEIGKQLLFVGVHLEEKCLLK